MKRIKAQFEGKNFISPISIYEISSDGKVFVIVPYKFAPFLKKKVFIGMYHDLSVFNVKNVVLPGEGDTGEQIHKFNTCPMTGEPGSDGVDISVRSEINGLRNEIKVLKTALSRLTTIVRTANNIDVVRKQMHDSFKDMRSMFIPSSGKYKR